MNFRALSRRGARWRQACYFLAARLLRFASFALAALPFSLRAARESRPYLTVVMSAPLRFSDPPPPPAPPAPKITSTAAVAPATTPAADVIPPAGTAPGEAANGPEPTPTAAPAPDGKPTEPGDKPAHLPPAILPDEARPKVHAEDFLPYFQFPSAGPNPNDNVLAPTPPEPGKLPPSSASYRQQ